ncbi:MAG: radical SAM protein [Pseudomonadales bacterium]|nr:radical SAM protein [Pseudomonadales bacterium]
MAVKPVVVSCAAAENRWTLPYLSLGMVLAHLRHYEQGALARTFDIPALSLVYGDEYPLETFLQTLPSDRFIILLLSSYVWNNQLNLEVARQAKLQNPQTLVILGGPEVPKYPGETEAFLQANHQIDIAVLGEGELSAAEVLSQLHETAAGWVLDELSSVAGIVFRWGTEIQRTQERQRVKTLESFPSPYLTGEYGEWFQHFPTAILETNRGCPFGCTYCDWGSATLTKISKFTVERVTAEIEYLAKHQAETVFVADANFGMLEQDIPIAEALVAAKKKHGYPKRLYTNFAKNGGPRLMRVIKILNQGGLLPVGIVALQTTDPTTLKVIKRDNIKTSSYVKMMEFFNAEGIPMASDLMIGLPGQTLESFATDLQFCFDWKVIANGNYTSLMPNAPMAEENYRSVHAIEADANGMIASTNSFSAQDLQQMKTLCLVYQFFVVLGVAKYFLLYFQTEHGILAVALLREWIRNAQAERGSNSFAGQILTKIIRAESREGDWALLSWDDDAEFLFQDIEQFYREFIDFIATRHALSFQVDELETLTTTQPAVMPRLHREYPYQVELPHDVVGFFQQHQRVASLEKLGDSLKPLRSFPPAPLHVSPKVRQRDSLAFVKIDGHGAGWELPSPLRGY